jgi:hypothetical protein
MKENNAVLFYKPRYVKKTMPFCFINQGMFPVIFQIRYKETLHNNALIHHIIQHSAIVDISLFVQDEKNSDSNSKTLLLLARQGNFKMVDNTPCLSNSSETMNARSPILASASAHIRPK